MEGTRSMKIIKSGILHLALLVNLMCWLVCIASAQIKIGHITISDSIAKDYFNDCQKNPDTLWIRVRYQFLTHEDSIILGASVKMFGESYDYTPPPKEIIDKSIGYIYATVDRQKVGYVIPRTPSADDFAKWFLRRARAMSN
jgi:hypothetical protein